MHFLIRKYYYSLQIAKNVLLDVELLIKGSWVFNFVYENVFYSWKENFLWLIFKEIINLKYFIIFRNFITMKNLKNIDKLQ